VKKEKEILQCNNCIKCSIIVLSIGGTECKFIS